MTTIAEGDVVPAETVHLVVDGGPRAADSRDVLGTGRVVLFAVPGAFTPGCSNQHLPGFLDGADELADNDVDLVACVAVNDAFVMAAWADAHHVGDQITMLADGNGAFTRAMGMEADFAAHGLGPRSKRYAAIIEDGRVIHLAVDEDGGIDASSCDAVLQHLDVSPT